jgi:hypothetical protein
VFVLGIDFVHINQLLNNLDGLLGVIIAQHCSNMAEKITSLMTVWRCTDNSTSDYTLWTLYLSYFKGFSANIELQVYSLVRCPGQNKRIAPISFLRLLLLLTLIPLSGVGTTCIHHVVIKIRSLFLRPAACLTSTLLETGVDANDCKYSRDQQLTVPSEARRSSR